MKKFIKKLFCNHEYYSIGIFNAFRQSPFHEYGVGWKYKCKILECIKCGKRKERVIHNNLKNIYEV